jgi:hypothetical protein
MAGLFETVSNYFAFQKFKRSSLGQALIEHTQQYFHSDQVLSHFSEESKLAIIQDFMTRLAAIVRSPDGRMELRKALVEYMIVYSGLTILCLTEEEKTIAEYAANPYISGELHHHIEAAAPHNEEMARFIWQENGDVTPADLMSFANQRSALMLYYLNGFNMVRVQSGDVDEAKDWFRPLVEAQLVWEEDLVREKLSLPRLAPARLYGLPYSTLSNLVMKGEANPLYSWTKMFPSLYLAGEGGGTDNPPNEYVSRRARDS